MLHNRFTVNNFCPGFRDDEEGPRCFSILMSQDTAKRYMKMMDLFLNIQKVDPSIKSLTFSENKGSYHSYFPDEANISSEPVDPWDDSQFETGCVVVTDGGVYFTSFFSDDTSGASVIMESDLITKSEIETLANRVITLSQENA